ncbi:hypothetical protein [Geodermatophilus sp. SYSU D00698]
MDAVLPDGGTAEWSAEVRELVAPLVADDGRVADWTTWWGPGAMTGLLTGLLGWAAGLSWAVTWPGGPGCGRHDR